jgi:hypothetical protein
MGEKHSSSRSKHMIGKSALTNRELKAKSGNREDA